MGGTRGRSGVWASGSAAGSAAATAAPRGQAGESRNPQAGQLTAELPARTEVLTPGSGDFASDSL